MPDLPPAAAGRGRFLGAGFPAALRATVGRRAKVIAAGAAVAGHGAAKATIRPDRGARGKTGEGRGDGPVRYENFVPTHRNAAGPHAAEAEELGVTQVNVDEMLGSDNPAIKRLLGVEGDFGTPLGLTKDWAYQIIKHLGNYSEIFERHVGPGTEIGLERGLNALWRDGGIQYAPPIR